MARFPSVKPTFTVIVPTSRRPSLPAAVGSVVGQLEPGDELIVVCSNDGDFGNRGRNSAIDRAQATHILFLDDDDEFLPDAFATMRQSVALSPGRVVAFKTRYELASDTHSIALGVAFPNEPGKWAGSATQDRRSSIESPFVSQSAHGNTSQFAQATSSLSCPRWNFGETSRSVSRSLSTCSDQRRTAGGNSGIGSSFGRAYAA
jgi:hypothetical protein